MKKLLGGVAGEALAKAVRMLGGSPRRPVIRAREVTIGRNVSFGRNVVFQCERLAIGDGTVFGDNVLVQAREFSIGDYGTIYRNCFFPGPGTVAIGHNFWLGEGCIVDGKGGAVIGDNVGVGAHSQLWTHMAFGDVLYGSRFHREKPLTIGHDAWLVGHCLVSPVAIGARSVAMLGSVVTKDLAPDRVYAGVPAHDVTERFGPPFAPTSIEYRVALLAGRIDAFLRAQRDAGTFRYAIVASREEMAAHGPGATVFNVRDRVYAKRGTPVEMKLLRHLLPDIKFVPDAPPAGP